MSIKDQIISSVLEYFGINEKEAEILKHTIQRFDFEETDDSITISCKKGFELKIEK